MNQRSQLALATAAFHNFAVGIGALILQRDADTRRRRRRRAPPRWWTRPFLMPHERLETGTYSTMLKWLGVEDQASFRNFTRIPPALFDELLQRIGPKIQRRNTNYRDPLDAGLKLALCLRFLATGDSYPSLQSAFKVAVASCGNTVMEVCRALVDELKDEVMVLPRTQADWRAIAQRFQDKWNMPHALGALDGKHVAIKKPNNSGSIYYNYKGFFSIVLMALVDADYKFVWIDIGGVGGQSDAQIFNESDLKDAMDRRSINFPPADPLPGWVHLIPYFILGDDAFALRPNLMKPYSHKDQDPDCQVASYRISRARRVVENAFGILANRWRCIRYTMELKPENVQLVVECAVVLHNLMRIRHPSPTEGDREDGEHNRVDGVWRRHAQVEEVPQSDARRNDLGAGKACREHLKRWFVSPAGSVPWQDKMAEVTR